MNERIRELWTQAEEEIKAEYEDESRRNRRLYNEIFLPKFAELIIRECASTAAYFSIENKRIHPDIDPREMPEANRIVYHSTCQCVADEIKQHFGVEE
jgi:hypothetical protein